MFKAAADKINEALETAGTKIEQAAEVAVLKSQETAEKLKEAWSEHQQEQIKKTQVADAKAAAEKEDEGKIHTRSKNTRRSFQNIKHAPKDKDRRPSQNEWLAHQPAEVKQLVENLPFEAPVEDPKVLESVEDLTILNAETSDWFGTKIGRHGKFIDRWVEWNGLDMAVRPLPGESPVWEHKLEKVELQNDKMKFDFGGEDYLELKPCKVTHDISGIQQLVAMKAEIAHQRYQSKPEGKKP